MWKLHNFWTGKQYYLFSVQPIGDMISTFWASTTWDNFTDNFPVHSATDLMVHLVQVR